MDDFQDRSKKQVRCIIISFSILGGIALCLTLGSFIFTGINWQHRGLDVFGGIDVFIADHPTCNKENSTYFGNKVKFNRFRCENLECRKFKEDWIDYGDYRCDPYEKSVGILFERDKLKELLACVELAAELKKNTIAFDSCFQFSLDQFKFQTHDPRSISFLVWGFVFFVVFVVAYSVLCKIRWDDAKEEKEKKEKEYTFSK